jgi:hypothetical protein
VAAVTLLRIATERELGELASQHAVFDRLLQLTHRLVGVLVPENLHHQDHGVVHSQCHGPQLPVLWGRDKKESRKPPSPNSLREVELLSVTPRISTESESIPIASATDFGVVQFLINSQISGETGVAPYRYLFGSINERW